ncbi:MAG: flavodoxin [Firmicutes bacterium]|nr:flavodoxin [Bacillota bacterium]
MGKDLKSLVIYYSLEGNTEFIAKNIAEEVNADLLHLQLKNNLNPNSFTKYIIGGKQVLFKQKPELKSYDIDPNEYDFIFIGSPVWAGKYVSAFNTFFNETNLSNKKIALFCCYKGQSGKTFSEFRQSLVDNIIMGEMEFKSPLELNKKINEKRVKRWAKELISKKG